MRLFLMAAICLAACNGNKNTTHEYVQSDTGVQVESPANEKKTDVVSGNAKPSEQTDCYMRTSGRDTVLLQMSQRGKDVTGNLKFDNYQIDGSQGTIKGTVRGDTLEIWYDFDAEGMHSVRQLFFKKTDDRLLWGKGEQVSRNDSTIYSDIKHITFSEVLFMRKTDCSMIR